MKKLALTLLALTAFTTAHAWFYLAEVDYEVGIGYRQDSLNWNIAGPSGEPTVLSELKWKDLQMWQADAKVNVDLGPLALRFYGDYARICDGKNRDSDYFANHRQLEFSRSYSKAGRGEAYDLSVAGGYTFDFGLCGQGISITPLAGYSSQEQRLHMYDGYQTIDLLDPSLVGPIYGLNSRYKSCWYGPWAGFEAEACLFNVGVHGSFEYHWANYRGRGHWNLRDDFVDDFRHSCNDAYGLVGKVGVFYFLDCGWYIDLSAEYQDWRARNGRHRVYFQDGGDIFYASTRLNDVNWHSFRTVFSLGYAF